MKAEYKRTGFQFDLMPWKLVFCDFSWTDCVSVAKGNGLRISDLPEAPEPGRIPGNADHLHIITKMSGERDAREEEKWRALVFAAARCDHGRMPEERCRGCRGNAPSMEGVRIGTTTRGVPVIVPAREDMSDIAKWTQNKD